MSATEGENEREVRDITCEQFFDYHCYDAINEYNSEAYWERSFSTETCLNIMIAEAHKLNKRLIDLETFDYDKFFYEYYKSDKDKGLS